MSFSFEEFDMDLCTCSLLSSISLSDTCTFSHSAQWFSLWDVYWYQPISHSRCRLSTMCGRIMSCVTWWCEKIQTLFIFRAICDNSAHVQWIKCSPKGSNLIHWTSALFFHIALEWTPFAYLVLFFHHIYSSFVILLIGFESVKMCWGPLPLVDLLANGECIKY